MNSIIPINLRGLFCLQKEASVSLGNITLQNVTMESDKYIVVRETLRNSVQVVILDMDKPKEVVRRPVTATADSALMNPSMKILALKYGKTLQLLDLEQKAQIKKHTATEHIAFWKWINEENIGIVTEEFVYHWAVAGNNEPIKMFQRHSTLINQPIINYRSDHEGKFLFLVGIVAKDHQVDGLVQLYNSESKESQLIEAHAACFAQFKMEANAQPSSLFCYSLGNKNGNGKLHIFELSPIGNNPYLQKTIDFHYPADAIGDFPVSIQPSSKSGILYLFTKLGYVHLFDIETGTAIYSMRISDKAILVTTEYTQNNGVLCIDGSGKVLSVCLEESMVIPFITHHLQNPNLAYKLALRCNLPVTEELIIFKNNHHSQVGATVDTWQQPDEKTQSMEQATASDVAASNPLFKSTPSKMIVFKEKSGLVGSASLTIKNCELRAIYFKVKSNSSHFYSVRPDNGIIEPQESVKLIIQPNDDCLANFDVMAIKTHKFLIMAAIVSDLKVQVEEFWKGKKQGTEGVYAKKLKAKVQKEIKKKSGQLSDNIWQSSESTSLKKEKRSKTENQLAEQNLPKQNQKMAPPILDNLPTTNLMSEKSLKRRSPITESLEMILESELEQNQILENLPNPSMAGPEEKLKKALQSSDELSGQNFKMASSSFSQAGSFVTVPEFALEQTMPKPSMKMPEGELKKAPQSSAELFEQNLRTASSSISDSLEIVPENESQRNQERPSPASENVQEFEFVPRVPKTALPTSEVVPSLSLKKGAIYSSSSANRSYGLYSGEKIISLLEKMSMKKAAQFRRELNSFLDKYEANILSGKDETL